MAWDRSKALMFMTSPLGADALIPTYLAADEEISHPFAFRILAISQKGAIKPDDLLNMPVCVVLPSDQPGAPPKLEVPFGSASYTFKNESDRQLLELALQVVGMKNTGKLENPEKIALDIMAHTQERNTRVPIQEGRMAQ